MELIRKQVFHLPIRLQPERACAFTCVRSRWGVCNSWRSAHRRSLPMFDFGEWLARNLPSVALPQNQHGHITHAQQGAGGAARYQLLEPRVAKRTHHQQICALRVHKGR